MSIPWLTVLQSVPWSDVISNAPKVADGAKKLWNTIGRKSSAQDIETSPGNPGHSPETQTLASLHAQIGAIEAAMADLHNQLLASSELIKALAEQNALLIAQAEAMRVRLRWMLAAMVAIGIATAYGLVRTFLN
ncbi:hypothetical protein [Dechloromonas sp. A34]|uniref:hypothetical protein n=1 Tax=Dechloromonas sp. A34 TaxID=447588 RepID=UPI0022493958|nr:hypothetical protein [Dechloromonas sp. A34]